MSEPQTPEEITVLWEALPAHVRKGLLRQIVRDLPHTKGASIVEIDEHELEADEATIVGERLAFIMLDSHHMYAMSFVPASPPGALLH